MVDRWAMKVVKHPLSIGAMVLYGRGISANQISVVGFILGMMSVPFLYLNWYNVALVCILLNRIADGLDGHVARMGEPTDAGAYLDISLDFIFYSAVVFGFALASPEQNSLAAAALIFSFIGTGSTFLAFGIMAERRGFSNFRYPNKGFYYLDGLAEGFETILFFVLCCLFPQNFVIFAWSFAVICFLTTFVRVISGFSTLRE